MSGSEWIIGYAVEADSPSVGTWRDTKLGGLPKWPPGSHPEVARCPQCNRERVLLLQAFAPHSVHKDRLLLVFACNSAVCCRETKNWCAYRAFQRKEVAPSEKVICIPSSVKSSEVINWDSDGSSTDDDESSDSDDLENLLQMQNMPTSSSNSEAYSKAKGNEQQVIQEAGVCKLASGDSSSPQRNLFLKPHFIEVAVEPKEDMKSLKDDEKVQKLLKTYKEEESHLKDDNVSTRWDGEDDREETDATLAIDYFRAKIDRAPEQVLRYKFSGDPVWPAHPPPKPQHLTCPHCGCEQVFELQILGSSLFFLEAERAVSGSQREAALNFMAMALYTCKNDCEQDSTTTEDTDFEFRTLEVRVQTDFW